ncbi:MAG: ABC transporter ATP-binding protein, partial [Actinobacteria bacterium ATB1]|nr:ABC transporter ATP-binding protein [Actinobacteria bacterium ATB1]
ELEVERALSAVSAGRTTVLIAHRLSTASRCDRIGVLSGGRLVETGTHDELLAAGGAYASLWAGWSQPGDLLDDVSTDPGIHPGIQ